MPLEVSLLLLVKERRQKLVSAHYRIGEMGRLGVKIKMAESCGLHWDRIWLSFNKRMLSIHVSFDLNTMSWENRCTKPKDVLSSLLLLFYVRKTKQERWSHLCLPERREVINWFYMVFEYSNRREVFSPK